ncbi:hypothetical protein [Pedobacter mendelii]|uniref:Uncharacterized protein n=1 Tax=Pedobacter mendelii TaxID=1908240 RepID=A0ABQ2BBM4_9SPHI|nr:hypothetical protein [Pedobacter mendelii]GGI22169.1 hypothetical protein GCM10008119_01300 [Pedobacter mendelii]
MDNKKKIENDQEPVKGQDFAKTDDENQKPSSHGEVSNQKGGDFTELEESRMENPPKNRDTNGSSKSDTKKAKGYVEQRKGID